MENYLNTFYRRGNLKVTAGLGRVQVKSLRAHELDGEQNRRGRRVSAHARAVGSLVRG